MPDDGFVDVPADGFIDVPAGTVGSTLLERLGRQAVAGIARFPTDTVLGIPGALGSDWAARNAQMIGNRIDSELGTREVNVFDPNNTAGDYSEFAVRNGISALVGLPVRAATAITGSIKPGMRIVEALTPVTLPLTRGNIVANAVGSNAVTAAVQGLNELDENARGRVVAPSDGFVDVVPEQAATPVPLDDGFVDVPTEQPRSTYGMIRDNVAPVMLGAAALLGGAGAARQVMRNRAANAAMDGSYVGQTQRGNDNYQPGAAETVVQQTLDETASAQAAMTRAAEQGLVTPEFARNANEGFSTNISPAPTMERAEEVLNTGRFLDTGITTIAPREYELNIANLGAEDPALYRLFNDASAAGDELNSRTALLNAGQRMPGPLQPGVTPSGGPQTNAAIASAQNPNATAARRFLRSEDDATLQQRLDAGYANPRVAQLMAERQQIQAALREFAVHERLYSQQTATKYANAHPEWIHTLDPDNSPFTRRNMTTNRTPEELSDPVISMHEAVRDYVDAALVNRQRRSLMEAAQSIARTTPDGLQTVGIGKAAPIALANANKAPTGTTIIRVKDGDTVMGVEVIDAVARGYQTVPRLVAPFLSSLSRAFSGATVGKVAALVGAVQAPTSAAFAGSAIMASRPRGTSAGILDSALLSATGRNLPIPDPTFILQSMYTGLAGIGAEASRAIASQVLRSIISDGALVRTLGPRTAAFIAKKFGDIYTASSLARARQGGLSTTGINFNPAHEQSIKFANKALTPEYRLLLPKDQAAQGLAAIEEFARFHGRQLSPAFVGRAWQLFGNMLDIVASAPNVAFANQNLGRAGFTDQAVYGMARRLAGDPAARGANPGLQMATSAIPFSNTTMQSIRAHARGFSEHPLRYASTYVMIGGAVPLITLASALLADEYEGGDKYINYMLNMSARDVLSGAMFFIPGVAPNNGMRVPVDPMFAPGIAAATATVTQFMGIEDYIKSGQLSAVRENIYSFLNDRNAQLASTSLTMALDPTDALSNITQGLGLGNQREAPGAPGYEKSNTFGGVLSADLESRIKGLFGAVGSTVVSALERATQGNGLPSGIDSYMQDLRRNRIAAPLLQPTRIDPQRGMIGELNVPLEQRFMEVARDFLPDVTRPGTIGSGTGLRAAMTGRQPPPESVVPVLAQMWQLHNRADMRVYREQRASAQQSIIDIRSSVDQFPNEIAVREAQNRQARVIREANAYMYNQMIGLQNRLIRSEGRDIDLKRVDPQRGIEQFERTTGR